MVLSKKRTRLLGIIAIAATLAGVFGMIALYRGALSPCLAPQLRSFEGYEAGFPIGQALDGKTITMDILGAAKQGPAFAGFGFLWVVGAVMVRGLLGWGNLEIPSREVKFLGIFGAVFQILGAFIFLYTTWGMVTLVSGDGTSPTNVTMNYGQTLRSTLSGLTTFGVGSLMTAIFLNFAITGESDIPSTRKRRIVSLLSFVPMGIAAIAIVNILIQLHHPETIKGTVLAAFFVAFALPMVVGSIPLLVSSHSIPRRSGI